MDRRHWLGLVGSGVGVSLGGSCTRGRRARRRREGRRRHDGPGARAARPLLRHPHRQEQPEVPDRHPALLHVALRGDAPVPAVRLQREERQAAGRRIHRLRPDLPRAARRREEILAPAHLRSPGRRPDRPEHEARRRADVHEGAPDHLGQDLAHLARPAAPRCRWASRS